LKPCFVMLLIVLATGLLLVVPVKADIPPYSLSVSPTTISLGNTVNIMVIVTSGNARFAYGVTIGVQKPNGAGSAVSNQVISTDRFGSGSVSVQYPTSTSWTPVNGTVATNVGGVYNVVVNQTSPTNIANVASRQFTVTAMMSVVVSQPTSGTIVQRGRL